MCIRDRVTATSTANDVINQAKAVNTSATNHKTDPAAHSELFAKPAPDVALSGGKTAKGQGQVGPCVRTAYVTDADQYVTDGRYYVYTTEALSLIHILKASKIWRHPWCTPCPGCFPPCGSICPFPTRTLVRYRS